MTPEPFLTAGLFLLLIYVMPCGAVIAWRYLRRARQKRRWKRVFLAKYEAYREGIK